MRAMSIIEALEHPEIFGDFSDPSWRSWKTFLKTVFALEMDDYDAEIFRECSGRTMRPETQCQEVWMAVGRRAGKSRVAALLATYLACFRKYPNLARGEVGTIVVVSSDRRQARTILRYVRGFLKSPLLAPMVVRETAELIELENSIVIEVGTCNHRSLRGTTVVAALLDEVAFYKSDDSASPDTEIVTALRPAMANVPGSILLALSSPYARKGMLWKMHEAHYGRDGHDILFWKAPTILHNPTISTDVIANAYQEDPSAAMAEWGGLFREDLEMLFGFEEVQRCVRDGLIALPPVAGIRYEAFVDPSGGKVDRFCVAVGHRDGERGVVDLVRGWKPPFNPSGVVSEIAEVLANYRITNVCGDRYAAAWCSEAFASQGIRYEPASKAKSDLYLSLVNSINSEQLEIPNDTLMLRELRALERRRGRSGRDSVDHPSGGSDDLCNVIAGIGHMLLDKRRGISPTDLFGEDVPPLPAEERGWVQLA